MSQQKDNKLQTTEVNDQELSQVAGGASDEPRVSQDGQGSGYTRLEK